MKNASLFFAALALFVSVSGCRKSDREEQTDLTSARDNAEVQSAFSGIWKQIAEVTDSTTQLRLASCATWTLDNYDTVTFPKVLTIDFGSVNCLCSDGNYRRGKIIATFSGKYRNPGTVISISLNNYFHNNNQVQGTQSITNNGMNAAGNLTYTAIVTGGSLTTTGGIITWSTSQTREWISGQSTLLNPFDDVYLVTGSAEGKGLNGNTYSVLVNTPLRIEGSCRYIVSGTFTVTPQNYSPITFDYGSGACDNSATATINGNTSTLTLY